MTEGAVWEISESMNGFKEWSLLKEKLQGEHGYKKREQRYEELRN